MLHCHSWVYLLYQKCTSFIKFLGFENDLNEYDKVIDNRLCYKELYIGRMEWNRYSGEKISKNQFSLFTKILILYDF